MISSESRTISGFRRSRTPSAPVENRKAATQRYQATSGPSIRALFAPRVVAEDDAADRGDEEDDRRDLEREQVVGEEEPPDLRGAAERAPDVRLVRERAARFQSDDDDDLDEQRARREYRADGLPARPSGPGRVLPRADVRDDEEEHHHHRAAVDEHLRSRDELRRQQQVENGERREVPDQRERGEERVRERHDRDPGAEARERGTEPDDPDERVSCRREQHYRSACIKSAPC